MPLTRLIYRSQNAMNVAGPRLLLHFQDIVATARRNNPSREICGFLMFDRYRFHQILEGPGDAVDRLFATISGDIRHTNVESLSREAIASRLFSDWSMGSFLTETATHPLMLRHAVVLDAPLEATQFLHFAMDFVGQPTAAK